MIERVRVAILVRGFINWGGGVDFIRNFIESVSEIESEKKLEIFIFVPKKLSLISKMRFYGVSFAKAVIKALKFQWSGFSKSLSQLHSSDFSAELMASLPDSTRVVEYDDRISALKKKLSLHKIKCALPSVESLGEGFPVPWAGYIFDFQHVYLPDYFTRKEIERRDSAFQRTLKNADLVIVNSQNVKQDIGKFFPEFVNKAYPLSFLPFLPECSRSQYKEDQSASIRDKYGIGGEFFLISNQFWLHKDHSTAFKAFAMFLEKLGERSSGVCLVCTGKTYDHRFPDYFSTLQKLIEDLNLSTSVVFTGYIPKLDQTELVKACLAVIQPTLFEGGPGGGSAYDAIAMEKRLILSDIPINKEIRDNLVTFFTAGSATSLCEKLVGCHSELRQKSNYENLIENSQRRRRMLGLEIFEAVSRLSSNTVA